MKLCYRGISSEAAWNSSYSVSRYEIPFPLEMDRYTGEKRGAGASFTARRCIDKRLSMRNHRDCNSWLLFCTVHFEDHEYFKGTGWQSTRAILFPAMRVVYVYFTRFYGIKEKRSSPRIEFGIIIIFRGREAAISFLDIPTFNNRSDSNNL